MRFFDTHIHLADFENVAPTELISMLRKAGISKCVCVCAKVEDFEKTAKFAHDFPFEVIPAFGVHPWYAHQTPKDFETLLEKYLQMFDNALIGECGFDRLKNKNFEVQKEVFDSHVRLSEMYHRPLLLHMVKADIWLVNYLPILPMKNIFHSFSGSVELLKQILKFGNYISVNTMFFKKSDAQKIMSAVPINKLLLESDAPFQSDPQDFKNLVRQIADAKNLPTENVAETLYLNAMELLTDD